MEVILEGMLERCLNDKRRVWKKSYFVFQRNFSTGSKTLECFKDTNWKKQEPRCVYNLYSEFSVRKVELKNRFAFELVTVDKVYLLSASADNLRQQWLDALLKAAGIKVFNVCLIESPPNAYKILKSFQGVLELHIANSFVMLVAPDSSKITWKFGMIRRYKSQSGFFILEVGRKSETGEGIFRFECNNPSELFDVLDKTLKDRIKEKGLVELIENQNSSPDTKGVRPNNTQLTPQLNPVTESEYSHISVNRQPGISTDNDYDVLSRPSTIEDTLNPTQPLSIQNMTSSLMVLNTQEEKQYEDMSNLVDKSIVKDISIADMETHLLPHERIIASSLTSNQNSACEQKPCATENVSHPSVEEEQYEDMSGKNITSGLGGKVITNNESITNKKPRPLPPPRVNKPTTPIADDASAALKLVLPNETEYENLLNVQMENINDEYVHLDSSKYNEKHKHSELNSPKNDRITNSYKQFNTLNQSFPSPEVIKKPVKAQRSIPLNSTKAMVIPPTPPNSLNVPFVTQRDPQKKYSLPDNL